MRMAAAVGKQKIRVFTVRSLVLAIFLQLAVLLLLPELFVHAAMRGVDYLLENQAIPYAKRFEVTAYTAGPESTGKDAQDPDYGVTASVYKLNVGNGEKCIAAPPEIRFGVRIFVPGYGVGVVRDRGEAIVGNRLDIYFDDVDDARRWGRQLLRVIVFP